MIDLTASRCVQSPSSALGDMSEACDELGITSWDMYGDFATPDTWINKFQAEVANLLQKEAALFVPSGVMAQQMALMIHAHDKPKVFVCHWSSHLLIHEHDSYASLLGFEARVVPPKDNSMLQEAMTYDDVRPLLDMQPHPACVILECPHREIGGKATSIEDIRRISEHCRRSGISLHMDGARLWEASAHYDLNVLNSFFDSIYVSFYKGLGGLTGAMLLGSDDFITSSCVWLRRFGGNLFTQLPYAVAAWKGLHTHATTFTARLHHLQRVVAHVTSVVDSKLVFFDPPVPVVSLVHVYMKCDVDAALRLRQVVMEETGVWCFQRVRAARFGASDYCYFEMNMVYYLIEISCLCTHPVQGPANMTIDISAWERGWVAMSQHLRKYADSSVFNAIINVG